MKAKVARCWFNTSKLTVTDHVLSAMEVQALREIALIRDALTQYEISLIKASV